MKMVCANLWRASPYLYHFQVTSDKGLALRPIPFRVLASELHAEELLELLSFEVWWKGETSQIDVAPVRITM
jgi:hypothetical protein